MEARKQSEKDFHNHSFHDESHLRERANKFYAITQSSHRFWQAYLRSRCAGKQVLHYGCGPGTHARFLAQQGAILTGVDISEVAIEKARAEAAREQMAGANFLVMDAEALEFADNSFDVICGSAILHHLDLSRAFPELVRTLKPAGSAVFLEALGHHPLINLYRRLTPQLRTPDEHPLLMRDLASAKEHFGRVELHFFHFLTLLALPFRGVPGFEKLVGVLDAFDQALFRLVPFVQRYSWIAVIILAEPQKRAASPGISTPGLLGR
jgi:SAM-dependent methyltransferase